MDIYEVLKQDHYEIKNLLTSLVECKVDDDFRYVLIEEIKNHLIPHARAEESIFYNTLRAIHADKKVVFHGYQEHLESETLLRSLQLMDKMNFGWKTIANKLKDAIFHHIETEETETFDEAKAAFTEDEAMAMAEAFEQLKPKVLQEGFVKNSVDLVLNIMPPRLTDKLRNFGGDEKQV